MLGLCLANEIVSCCAASHEDKYISNGGDNNARHLLGSNPTQLILQPVARLSFSEGRHHHHQEQATQISTYIYNERIVVSQELIVQYSYIGAVDIINDNYITLVTVVVMSMYKCIFTQTHSSRLCLLSTFTCTLSTHTNKHSGWQISRQLMIVVTNARNI